MGKLEKKRLDMIVAKRVGDEFGFDRDDNAVDVYWQGGEREFPTAAKTLLAGDIVQLVAERYEATRGNATKPELTVVSLKD